MSTRMPGAAVEEDLEGCHGAPGFTEPPVLPEPPVLAGMPVFTELPVLAGLPMEPGASWFGNHPASPVAAGAGG
jgi:hypothetical protein